MAIQETYTIELKNPEARKIIRKAIEDKERLFSSTSITIEEVRKSILKKKKI